jgi:hypothetical protein
MRTIKLNNSETTLLGKYQSGLNIVLCDASYGAYTVYVPDAKAIKDVIFLFKKTDAEANTITIRPIFEGQLFDTSEELTLESQNDTEQICSDNANYVRMIV